MSATKEDKFCVHESGSPPKVQLHLSFEDLIERVSKLINPKDSNQTPRDEHVATLDVQKLILCLTARRATSVLSDINGPSLKLSKEMVERLVVIWLAGVPGDACKSLPSSIKCVLLTGEPRITADAFLSGNRLQEHLRPEGQARLEHSSGSCAKSELLLSLKQMRENSFPIPSPSAISTDKARTTKFGRFIYKFEHAEKCYLTYYKDFSATTPSEDAPMYSIDCEMVKTTKDHMALGRVSIIDEKLVCVYDSYVLPPDPILDYMTQYSGITPQDLSGVTTTLENVQRRILTLIPPDAILIGQSLENDLCALQFSHPYIIDTSILFVSPHQSFKPSLVSLAYMFLKRKMKRGKNGHNSVTDASVCMELVQAKLIAGPKMMLSYAGPEISILQLLTAVGVRSIMVDSTGNVNRYSQGNTHSYKVHNDHRALWCVQRFQDGDFGWVQLLGYQQAVQSGSKNLVSKIGQLQDAVQFVLSSLPSKTLTFVIYEGSTEEPFKLAITYKH